VKKKVRYGARVPLSSGTTMSGTYEAPRVCVTSVGITVTPSSLVRIGMRNFRTRET